MPRYLTGIQSSGKPHLGNLLGAIMPALRLAKSQPEPAFLFIADLHTFTSSRNAEVNRTNTLHVAASWLACGLDTQKDVFYRQSDVPEVCELAWYLNCFTPYPMLANAHSFKEKSANLALVSAGVFTYPVLMAADIFFCDAEQVPVGKDQIQHLEIARDIAGAFNREYQQDVLVLPEAYVQPEIMTIPGTDGRKMSKSYNNYINVFDDEKALRKTVMSIQTDSTPLEAPKNPDTDNVFAIYKLLATKEQTQALRALYEGGNFGYGTAKQMLYELILELFAEPRKRFAELMAQPDTIEAELLKGAEKARAVGSQTLRRVRKTLGLRV
jgi:tryptophanyl-tRNA synthetase